MPRTLTPRASAKGWGRHRDRQTPFFFMKSRADAHRLSEGPCVPLHVYNMYLSWYLCIRCEPLHVAACTAAMNEQSRELRLNALVATVLRSACYLGGVLVIVVTPCCCHAFTHRAPSA